VKVNWRLGNNFELRLPTTLPQKYKCHVEQYNFFIFQAGWVHLIAVRTKKSIV